MGVTIDSRSYSAPTMVVSGVITVNAEGKVLCSNLQQMLKSAFGRETRIEEEKA